MAPQNPVSPAYRIEVSGWDMAEDFFVENAEVEWSESQGKSVYLRHSVRDGAVVFIRASHPTVLGEAFPIACKVKVGPTDHWGRQEVSLVPLGPRAQADDPKEQLAAPVLEEKPR